MGTFDWSLYQRRFDGVRAEWNGARVYGGAGAFLPAQGGFEESANLSIPRIQLGTTWLGWRHGGGQAESQVSGQWYRDRREIDIRPDNALLPTDRVDVTVWSLGASHVRTRVVGDGEADLAMWGAVQGGDWYGEAHRAWSATLQGGFQWSSAPWRPWARGGWSYASGDEAARDGRHQTWFPMLGETRPFALSMVYAPMNLRDVFAQVHVRPHPRRRPASTSTCSTWRAPPTAGTQGSGATAREGRFFGFTTCPANGQRALGTILEGTADVRLSRTGRSTPTWAACGRPGRPDVLRRRRLLYWYVENVLALRVGKWGTWGLGLGSWDLGLGSWVLGLGSWVLGWDSRPGSRGSPTFQRLAEAQQGASSAVSEAVDRSGAVRVHVAQALRQVSEVDRLATRCERDVQEPHEVASARPGAALDDVGWHGDGGSTQLCL